jgi:hypothetical protein
MTVDLVPQQAVAGSAMSFFGVRRIQEDSASQMAAAPRQASLMAASLNADVTSSTAGGAKRRRSSVHSPAAEQHPKTQAWGSNPARASAWRDSSPPAAINTENDPPAALGKPSLLHPSPRQCARPLAT